MDSRVRHLSRSLFAALAGAFATALTAASVAAEPAVPGDFGPNTDIISFDSLRRGTPVDRQYTLQGLRLSAPDGSPLVVATAADCGAIPASAPHALRVETPALQLRLDLWSARSRIGLSVGGFNDEAKIVLDVFDGTGEALDRVTVSVPANPSPDVVYFIGSDVGTPAIEGATVTISSTDPVFVFDDLLLEPSQESNVDTGTPGLILGDPASGVKERLSAASELQLLPSVAASLHLQGAVQNDTSPAVREAAMQALTQIADPSAIPIIAVAGEDKSHPDLRMVAHNAVWSLRQLFPHLNPPSIVMRSAGPFLKDRPFLVEVQVDTASAWRAVEMGLEHGKNLVRRNTPSPRGWEGDLLAGESVVLEAEYTPEEEGYYAVPFRLQSNFHPVDNLDQRAWLYVHVDSEGGEASSTPFSDPFATVQVLGQEN